MNLASWLSFYPLRHLLARRLASIHPLNPRPQRTSNERKAHHPRFIARRQRTAQATTESARSPAGMCDMCVLGIAASEVTSPAGQDAGCGHDPPACKLPRSMPPADFFVPSKRWRQIFHNELAHGFLSNSMRPW